MSMETDEKPRGKEAAALSGGHLCHVCGYQYPNPHPSAKLRRSHRKHCGKAAPAPAAVEEEEAVAVGRRATEREQRNAREGTLPLPAGKEGEAEGESEDNGGAALHGSSTATEVGESEDNKAVAEHASSNGTGLHNVTRGINENGQINSINTANASPDDEVVNSELSKNGVFSCSSNSELVNEGNGTHLPISCNNGSQNEVAKHCSEFAPTSVTNPAEREDSFDEYQDASPFLNQSDLEESALPSSEFLVHINNLNTVLSGSSAAGNEISLGTNGLSNEQASGELNLNDMSAASKFETSNAFLKTLTGSSSNTMPFGNELPVVHSENNPAYSPTELPTQNWTVEDTSNVQPPVEKCQNSFCSTVGFQNNLPTTSYVDDTLKSITKDSRSVMDFTFEAMMQRELVEHVNVAEENPSVQKTSGFTEDEVCSKLIDREVPTGDQFLKSQKHDVLPTSQTSCAKNPFDLDDDRSDELFELSTNSCYLEVPSAVSRQEVDSASLVLDKPTVSNQPRMSEVQRSCNSNDASSSSENGHPNCPDYMPDSNSAELMINTRLADAPLNHRLQEHEAHTNGISFVPCEVAPMEFHTVCTQDISALVTSAEENTQSEAKDVTDDIAAKMNEVQHCNVEEKHTDSTKEVSVLQSMSNLQENKLTEDPNLKEVNADDLEGKWQADDTNAEKMNGIACIDNFEEMYAQATRAKEGDNKKEDIAVTGGRLNSGRIRVPLKVLLAEASAENKVKPSAKERVLSFGRRVSKNDNSSAKSGSPKSGCDDHSWDSPAKLPRKDTDKSSKGRKQPWMPFICCHSVR